MKQANLKPADLALQQTWSTQQSAELYRLPYWSEHYFQIAENGVLQVCPQAQPMTEQPSSIDLLQLLKQLREQGLGLPVLLRFPEILQHRVQALCQAFAKAKATEAYQSHYTVIYPIKVNQQRTVVEEILAAGQDKQYRVGLEAGSKPELMAVLALAPVGSIVICNGYKDEEYIRLALIGLQLGLELYLVVEKLSELRLILQHSQVMQVTPRLGVRVRLASISAGKWQNTGGEKAKFGLSSSQVLEMIEQLQAAGHIDWLQLMHFHMGSQVANIRDIQHALNEAARYYYELHQLGAPVAHVDIGGGLGVDYEGSQSRTDCSMNYNLQEYANDVVAAFARICVEHKLAQPHLLSESGRALTAHHAMLVTQVTDVESLPQAQPAPPQMEEPSVIQEMRAGLQALNQRSLLEVWHDACYWMEEAHNLFNHGLLNLAQRACAEHLYFATCQQIQPLLQPHIRSHREVLDELHEKLADKYFCNFSLFQSMPDAWAISQVFPILPLQNLHQEPQSRAILQDLTCDSDGQFRRYVDALGIESSLPVHKLQAGEDYLLGVFMVGAYQEILGDMHNLFGDTHAVNVRLHGQAKSEVTSALAYQLDEIEPGDSVEDMLNYVHFDVNRFRRLYRQRLQNSVLNSQQQRSYLDELQAGLQAYTYLEQ
ncbi:biosynthetic arginine decarboxylase [Candidatus Venteria ishoeyi]|uniref:biosynthetic arginine decarboxylase n=1 Tax=Candidatus Venteria ishoeyi TaxID=1899563 RepID=UPI0025A5749F|nr:biosynthetic arginine decarboxylase [Candidatus Venteria ishoeyi]MDM8547198.1 biosynthetic arginine decarboxylase [Candidatus Venteria ishoeyi]